LVNQATEKIEEQALYIVELNKKLEQQNKELNSKPPTTSQNTARS